MTRQSNPAAAWNRTAHARAARKVPDGRGRELRAVRYGFNGYYLDRARRNYSVPRTIAPDAGTAVRACRDYQFIKRTAVGPTAMVTLPQPWRVGSHGTSPAYRRP